MFEIKPYIPDRQQIHEDSLWIRDECYRFYVEKRKLFCDHMQLLDLWLLSPFCEDCLNSEPYKESRCPEIQPENWELDFICELGFSELERIKEILSKDPDYSFRCKECWKELAPWNGDEVYIVKYHLEEHYGIPLFTDNKIRVPQNFFTDNKIRVPQNLQRQILKLYGNKCFSCGAASYERELHIDHILPRSKGGDAAFRNLQPLCKKCGERKGAKNPATVEIGDTSYFGPYPADSYGHLFW